MHTLGPTVTVHIRTCFIDFIACIWKLQGALTAEFTTLPSLLYTINMPISTEGSGMPTMVVQPANVLRQPIRHMDPHNISNFKKNIAYSKHSLSMHGQALIYNNLF